MSDSVRYHRWQPTGLPRPWDSPGKNTGAGCPFRLQGMKVKSESEVAQSYLTLSDPMDCSPPGSSTHGIFQTRVLEWGAIAFSREQGETNEPRKFRSVNVASFVNSVLGSLGTFCLYKDKVLKVISDPRKLTFLFERNIKEFMISFSIKEFMISFNKQ